MNGWWCVTEDDLLAMLRAVANGEDPDIVYAEAFANSDHQAADDE